MIENEWPKEKLDKLCALLSCQEIRILSKQGGGNSVVFCIKAATKKWALKSYPPYAPNQRDRLAAEWMVYQFLNRHAIPSVPTIKNHSELERWLIIDWVEGEVPTTYSKQDIDQAIIFLQHIHTLNALSDAADLPQAAEACLSLTDIIHQIQRRLQNLKAIAKTEPDLAYFLTNTFQPVFEHYQEQALEGYSANHLDPIAALPQTKRSLIPADFGFHNTIRDSSGKLYFFDFDYFGWDDPVKLLADIIWHPKMKLSNAAQQQFIHGITDIYRADPTFSIRFQYTKPLFGLRWVLILLNEFIPAFWQNRQHAGAFKNQFEAKQSQLNFAKELILHLQPMETPYESTLATSI